MYRRIALVSTLFAATLCAQGPVIKRDFHEFLTAQANSFWTWNDRVSKNILTDYFGTYNALYHLNLGTQVDGSVSERAQSDGTALVTVIVHTTDALTYGWDTAKGPGLVFGYTVAEIANQHKPAALGDVLLKVEFVNPAPGAPFPVITTLAQPRLQGLMLEVSAKGQMRAASGVAEGTPGTAQTTQVGLYGNPVWGTATDNFPAEKITFQPNGKH